MPVDDSVIARASAVEQAYRLCDGLYLLGMVERGVTLYNQQVRAHDSIGRFGSCTATASAI